MFPHPRQPSMDNVTFLDEKLKTIKHDRLMVHGCEDKVVHVKNSERLNH